MDINQIKDVLQKNMGILQDQYGVENIGVFGSVSRGEEKKGSDVDVLVEFSRPLGFFKFVELEEFLGSLIDKKVDLVTKKALKSVIRNEILQEVNYV